MADDAGEKTEEPTGKKLEDARKKGQVPRSKEFGTALVLIGSALTLLFFGDGVAKALFIIFEKGLGLTIQQIYDPAALGSTLAAMAEELVTPLFTIFMIILFAAFLGNILLGGFNWSAEAMQPKLSKMSPIAGLKRMFGIQALVELGKAILKVTVIATFSYIFLSTYFIDILHLSIESTPSNIFSALDLLAWIFLGLTLGMTIIAVVDAPFQKWNHNKQLRMTKQEIKDEYKNTEGSPEVKGRIRRLQHEAAQRRMMQDVPDADVVVTNPTHFSIAIKYDSDSAAPKVIAKGVDEMAMKIREIAANNQVAMIASPTLARTIYYTTEINEEIPEKLYIAVAQVLAYVFQLKQFKSGKGKKPTPLAKNLPIPEDIKH